MNISTNGTVFVLSENTEHMQIQIDKGGVKTEHEYHNFKNDLANNVSTDEIIPGRSCFWYDETLGGDVYTGFRTQNIQVESVRSLKPSVVISGHSKGCGSSREHAPLAELYAGVKIVLAKSFEKIYYQNCINIGLLPTTNFAIVDYLFNGEDIPIELILSEMTPIDREIISTGNLFKYNLKNQRQKTKYKINNKENFNLMEKIINSNASYVPGKQEAETLFLKTDIRFSHEYVTPMSRHLFEQQFGQDQSLTEPESIICFQDHLTHLKQTLPKERRNLANQALQLIKEQREFVGKHGVQYYSGLDSGVKSAICHNALVEDLAMPGQVIVGTDSHTCTSGCLGALAFGIGATDMANAWYTNDVKFRLPKAVSIELKGELSTWVAAKDLVLHLLALNEVKTGQLIGSVIHYHGQGLKSLSMDDRSTIANMAVEMGAATAIFEVDGITIDYLKSQRDMKETDLEEYLKLKNDPGASFELSLSLDLSKIATHIALPGDPKNSVPLDDISTDIKNVRFQTAYGGSCTGAKKKDMDHYAAVIAHAKKIGQNNKANDVDFFIQYGSDDVKNYSKMKGYHDLFESFGVKIIEPSCGACINAGPGVSKNKDQVTISSQNRNFPGRSGPGKVYLASPTVVAISGVLGFLETPDNFFRRKDLEVHDAK
jgi:3-isopropylmalate/(R)-2-methylmalate dehydratase large subunit